MAAIALPSAIPRALAPKVSKKLALADENGVTSKETATRASHAIRRI
jgi:hypothetical protein